VHKLERHNTQLRSRIEDPTAPVTIATANTIGMQYVSTCVRVTFIYDCSAANLDACSKASMHEFDEFFTVYSSLVAHVT
jgi:hypothetical protein